MLQLSSHKISQNILRNLAHGCSSKSQLARKKPSRPANGMAKDKNRPEGSDPDLNSGKTGSLAWNGNIGNKQHRAKNMHGQRKELNQAGSRFAVLNDGNDNITEDLGRIHSIMKLESGPTANAVCNKIGCDGNFKVKADGFRGGSWVFWRSDAIDLHVISSSPQFVTAEVFPRDDET
ncbi:hypothetical protein Cgig2_002192 [Carnegiea gigantea]|uniref:Uncharacterized protein n=1 Tax=Carnegiea gigantea TaxID=171969 RepID=A0A9Q1QQ67_9CARY|nr:hypothetical protein Cgig2_002192 [Carnegiea gigantea]